MSIVTRFAPSPTGHLHLGHAFSALIAWRRARAAGGRFLLRLEDIDPTRCRPEFATAILEDLAWLGLDWDGEVRVQSGHLAEYRAVLDALATRGLLYPCFCTRADIQQSAAAPHTPDGAPLYPGTCRSLSADERDARIAAGERYALRLDMARALSAVSQSLTFGEEGEAHHRLPPRTVRRCCPRPQGRSRQLPFVRHPRRRVAGCYADHAWRRPEAGDASASPVAGADGLAGSGLRPPRIADRRLRPPAGETRSRHDPARVARPGSFTRSGAAQNIRLNQPALAPCVMIGA